MSVAKPGGKPGMDALGFWGSCGMALFLMFGIVIVLVLRCEEDGDIRVVNMPELWLSNYILQLAYWISQSITHHEALINHFSGDGCVRRCQWVGFPSEGRRPRRYQRQPSSASCKRSVRCDLTKTITPTDLSPSTNATSGQRSRFIKPRNPFFSQHELNSCSRQPTYASRQRPTAAR